MGSMFLGRADCRTSLKMLRSCVVWILRGLYCSFLFVGCESSSTEPSDQGQTTPMLNFPITAGSRWTYRHSYLAGVGSATTESRNGVRVWQLVSSSTMHDTTICTIQVAVLDTVYRRELGSGHDTTFVASASAQFSFSVSPQVFVTDWKMGNALSTTGTMASTVTRTMTQTSDTVQVNESTFGVSAYVLGVGLLRYVYTHGTPGGHTGEELVLVDKSIP
jgi:hypothetical protein